MPCILPEGHIFDYLVHAIDVVGIGVLISLPKKIIGIRNADGFKLREKI